VIEFKLWVSNFFFVLGYYIFIILRHLCRLTIFVNCLQMARIDKKHFSIMLVNSIMLVLAINYCFIIFMYLHQFNCTDKCPESAPHKTTDTANGVVDMICVLNLSYSELVVAHSCLSSLFISIIYVDFRKSENSDIIETNITIQNNYQ